MSSTTSYADVLNSQCRCVTLCEKTLQKKYDGILAERPNLFSQTTTFMGLADYQLINDFVSFTEKMFQQKNIQEKILGRSMSHNSSFGVFMGYDFHLTQDGPRLIEINTNAGGAYLNLILAQSQIKCCEEENLVFSKNFLNSTEHQFVEMFRKEWAKAGNISGTFHIAIVDDHPKDQFLYPEFILFKELFQQHGLNASIVDPSEIESRADGIYFDNRKIDMIYNRLTDFYLRSEQNLKIKMAWKKEQVVLTPDPDHHALYANKKNLSLLESDEVLALSAFNDEEKEIVKRIIPRTRIVSECSAQTLWEERKKLFFKPFEGFGSKATYRGDKLTQKVWKEILEGNYVAQDLIPPGHRVIKGRENSLKSDIRAYTYRGEILLMAARLYEGQTTNFRTSGGGFSPVFVLKGGPHGTDT